MGPRVWGALGPALEWGTGGCLMLALQPPLTSPCFLREVRGGEGEAPPPQPTTWAPRPAKQVNVLSFCNKGMELWEPGLRACGS